MELKADLNIENKNGFFSIESRTDEGVGLYLEVRGPFTHMALTKDEAVQLAKWLVEWISQNTKIM